MDSTAWDDRYAASDLVWSATPNVWVEQVCAPLTPGTALDLAAGEGRNALWLAASGWQATAVDFSAVALDRARRLADERLGAAASRLRTVRADLRTWTPDGAYDLVLVVYLQVAAPDRTHVLRTAARCLAPGGRLVVVAHHGDNLAEGVGGPQDPAVLYGERDVLADLTEETSPAAGDRRLTVERAERVLRAVPGSAPDGADDAAPRHAVDTLVVLRRAPSAS